MSDKHIGATTSRTAADNATAYAVAKAGCDGRNDAKTVACMLDSGKGAVAQKLLNDATIARTNKDPDVHKAFKEMTNPSATPAEKWNAVDKDSEASGKVVSKLWQDVQNAQAKTAHRHLCKLELTNIDGSPSAEIKNSKTCKNPPIRLE